MPYQPLSDQASPPGVYVRNAPPAPAAPPLTQCRRVQVAVVGGGFTGVSAALHLAEVGVEVAVLEAKQIGWGASGRAFGQVVPSEVGEAILLAITARTTRRGSSMRSRPALTWCSG